MEREEKGLERSKGGLGVGKVRWLGVGKVRWGLGEWWKGKQVGCGCELG